ncbi:hypothetical protein CY34DRAFT_27120 [Suillus luteus UH-Slu-Lm8-n1]|uniref:Uncharacterized protein n=1 Tax=Suillus luteus UH-Slu-Lm8-n1 TaxID=930992 RepID=A0A0D0A483_9AGAM|nr:hypothetical protein CY34DRAFT_27120 [Suillus luteus UH-Slu-Lm8-n1]
MNKIIINLYTDDTTIFLNESHNYCDLETILKKWYCVKPNQLKLPLDNNIRIAPDGHPVRLLGAWIDNKTDDTTPWESVLNNINIALKRWKNDYPTLDGKRLIVQMIVGGMTQFLIKAQGFIWDNACTPPINLKQLH